MIAPDLEEKHNAKFQLRRTRSQNGVKTSAAFSANNKQKLVMPLPCEQGDMKKDAMHKSCNIEMLQYTLKLVYEGGAKAIAR